MVPWIGSWNRKRILMEHWWNLNRVWSLVFNTHTGTHAHTHMSTHRHLIVKLLRGKKGKERILKTAQGEKSSLSSKHRQLNWELSSQQKNNGSQKTTTWHLQSAEKKIHQLWIPYLEYPMIFKNYTLLTRDTLKSKNTEKLKAKG